MSYQYCLIHQKVSGWGCPICRRIELKRGMAEAVAEAKIAMREAFRAEFVGFRAALSTKEGKEQP